MAFFLKLDDEADQYAFAYVLRPGEVSAHYGAKSILSRTIKKLRLAFCGVKIRVSLDGGYCSPDLMDFLDEQTAQQRNILSISLLMARKNAYIVVFSASQCLPANTAAQQN